MKYPKLKLAALSVCLPGFALAQTTWNSTVAGGLWTTAANWSNGLPSTTNSAAISMNAGTAQLVTLASANPGFTSGLSLTNDGAGALTVRSFTTAASETQTLTFDSSGANVAISSSGSGGGSTSIVGRLVLTKALDITATKALTFQMNGGTTGITGTGAVNVLDGTVTFLRANTEVIGARAYTVGDGTGAAGSALLRLTQNNMFLSTGGNTNITVRSDGRFDVTLGSGNNTLGSDAHSQAFLALQGGGQITQAAGGTLIVRNNGTGAVLRVPNLGGATTATISGGGTLQLDLSTATSTGTREISIAQNTASGVSDLRISNLISDGDDNMSYNKTGLGTLELTADSTASLDGSGAWNVNAGTLLVNNTAGSGTGASSMSVTVANGAALGGDGSIAGAVSFASGANFIFNTTASLTVTGAVSFGGFGIGNVLGLDGNTIAGTYVLLDGTGSNISQTNVLFGPANKVNLGADKIAYLTFTNGDLGLEVAAIPEPGAFAALGGFVALGWAGLRRRRRSA